MKSPRCYNPWAYTFAASCFNGRCVTRIFRSLLRNPDCYAIEKRGAPHRLSLTAHDHHPTASPSPPLPLLLLLASQNPNPSSGHGIRVSASRNWRI